MKKTMVSFVVLVALAPASLAFAQAGMEPVPSGPPPPAQSSAPVAGTVSASAIGEPTVNGPTAWGILAWGGFGVGARYMLGLPIPTFLGKTPFKDRWALEFGADFIRYSYGWGTFGGSYAWNQVLPVAGMMWTVWFNESFCAYPKVELGFGFGWFSDWQDTWGSQPTHGGFWIDGTAGVMYKLKNGVAFRGELGAHGVKAGAGFLF